MTLHLIAVYHNTDNPFLPYEPDHPLTQVISHWRRLPDATSPDDCADWAFYALNADLDRLEGARTKPEGEACFLFACTYRLLRLRSMSTGDVVAVTIEGTTTWLACERVGWRRIAEPADVTSRPLITPAVVRCLRGGDDA